MPTKMSYKLQILFYINIITDVLTLKSISKAFSLVLLKMF